MEFFIWLMRHRDGCVVNKVDNMWQRGWSLHLQSIVGAAFAVVSSLTVALANDNEINSIVQGLPGQHVPVVPHAAPRQASGDARTNAIVQGLTPRSTASAATISIARSDFFLQLNLHYDRSSGQSSSNLRVGQVVPGSVTLMDIPGRLTAVWSEALGYFALPTRTSIFLIEKNSRKVAFVLNRDNYFIFTPDPNVRIILDTQTNKFCIIDVKASASWNIPFAFDSDRLLPEARDDLQQIVGLLRHASLGTYKFFVTGHTDGVGSREYNYDLSLRRAKAVVDHLVWTEAITPSRVKWSGRGSDELLYPKDSRNPRNRRVNLHPTINEC
jgi:outer membrane protein OmpA-like peptidoglycan-associated protein